MTALLLLAGVRVASAQLDTTEIGNFLLVGMGPVNALGPQPGVGQAVNVNNFELGANKAPVPSTSGFLSGGSSGGPGLRGNVPNIPLNALPVTSGICNDGNVAITSPDGVFNLQDVGVYADLGIVTDQSAAAADVGTMNSFFNDPNHFPNTFTSSGFSNPGVNHNTDGTGNDVNPGAAVQATRIDDPNFAGVTGNVDFATLLAEKDAARSAIPALAVTQTLNLAGRGGKISTNTTITLAPGLNVIDIVTGGNDFLIENSNLVIDGPPSASAIFRVPDAVNMLISNSNVLVGTGGIGLGRVLFYSDRPDNAQHFNFSNTVLNGVAFWTVANTGGEINIDNAQGCTQLVADKITLNDVRFCRCAFAIPTPAPTPTPTSTPSPTPPGQTATPPVQTATPPPALTATPPVQTATPPPGLTATPPVQTATPPAQTATPTRTATPTPGASFTPGNQPTATPTPVVACGDGIVDPDETCDPPGSDPPPAGGNLCRLGCTYCGDGQVQAAAGEQCDDGNTIDSDDCRNDCTPPPPPLCGNGRIDPEETCEPPGSMPLPDGTICRTDCTFCGDAVFQPGAGEQCDDGNDDETDGCRSDCTFTELNSFQCYETHRPKLDLAGVSLDDVFGPSTILVKKAKRLCAPANVDGQDTSAPGDPDHLTFYTIKQTTPRFFKRRGVVVTNHLGIHVVDVLKPDRLLLPTKKSVTGYPPFPAPFAVEHFKCYRVKAKSFRRNGFEILDQFGMVSVDIKKPGHLCMPADKNDEGITDPSQHLLCYQVRLTAGTPLPARPGTVFTDSQFGPDVYGLFGPRDLCVPSTVMLPRQ